MGEGCQVGFLEDVLPSLSLEGAKQAKDGTGKKGEQAEATGWAKAP